MVGHCTTALHKKNKKWDSAEGGLWRHDICYLFKKLKRVFESVKFQK